MNHFLAGAFPFLMLVATFAACGGAAGTREARRDSAAGAAGPDGLAGTKTSGTGALEGAGSTGPGGAGHDSAGWDGDRGGSRTGSGASEQGGGEAGFGEASDNSGGGGTGTEETDVGGTMDIGGVGGTIDTGAGGSLDLGAGGSLDLGAGGSLDLGTGGTLDTCIPSCTPDLLGVGEKAVNLVVFEDAKATGCDTEGRMWVGGNASLEAYGVGHQLKTCDPTDPVLVVGGDLHLDGGIKGSIWVGGDWDESTRARPECGAILSDKPGPVDFAFVEAQLTAYSKLLASYPVNGKTSSSFGSLTFEGTDKDMNIFTVDGGELAAANGLSIEVPKTSTVIINVTGTATGFHNGTQRLPDGVTCGSGAVKLDDFCNQVVWNMPDVKKLEVSGTAVQGTILAPQATLTGSGQVNGTVIIKNLVLTSCVEMHPHYFNGCLCTKEVNSRYACCPK